jgi:hypothetical protein
LTALILALGAIGTAFVVLVAIDDALTVVKRVGVWCAILTVLLVLGVVFRAKILPDPSASGVLVASVAMFIGFGAVVAIAYIADQREDRAVASQRASAKADGLHEPGAQLSGLRYDHKSLMGSDLEGAHLTDVSFVGANVSESIFRNAVFDRVDFSETIMCAVDARGADFSQSMNLDSVADFSYFVYDEATLFPEQFFITAEAGPILANGTTSRTAFPYSCSDQVTRVMTLGE